MASCCHPSLAPPGTRSHARLSHLYRGSFPFLETISTYCPLLEGGRKPGPRQEGDPCCQQLPPPVTQRGSNHPKEAHAGLSQLYKATPLKTTGWESILGGSRPDSGVSCHLPSACTVPRCRGPRPQPALIVGSWQESSKHTQTIRGAPGRAGWVKQRINASLLRPREAEVGRGRGKGPGLRCIRHPHGSNAASQDSN